MVRQIASRSLAGVALVSLAGCGTTTTTVDEDNGCPPGMVVVDASPAFCIDATETTRAAYAEWMASPEAKHSVDPRCTDEPSVPFGIDWPPPPGDRSLPVAGIDWCEGLGFCQSQGKYLCGSTSGPSLDVEPSGGATGFRDLDSAFYFACSDGGDSPWGYGAEPVADACADVVDDGPEAIGSRPSCEGGTPGAFDLAGNVFEWTDECAWIDSPEVGGAHQCVARGMWEGCDGSLRVSASANVWRGFRCCADFAEKER